MQSQITNDFLEKYKFENEFEQSNSLGMIGNLNNTQYNK